VQAAIQRKGEGHHMLASQSVTELATIRKTILERSIVNQATELRDYEELSAVENRIETATFNSDAEKLAGLLILFELNDAPDLSDQFKAKLFSRIHEFI
jgi:hypothetical protein